MKFLTRMPLSPKVGSMTNPQVGREERISLRLTSKGKRAIQRRAGLWKVSTNEAARHMLAFAEREMGDGDPGPRN